MNLEKLLYRYRKLNFNDKTTRVKSLVSFFFVVGIMALAFFLVLDLESIDYRSFVITLSFLIVSITAFLIFRKIKNLNFGSWSVVLIFFLLEFFLFFELTDNGYGFFWYFVFPLLAVSILGKYKGVFLTILLFFSTVVIVRLHLFEIKISFTQYFLTRFALGYFAVALFALIFEIVAEKTREDYQSLIFQTKKYVEKIEKFNSQLKEAHNELMISQMDLQETSQNLDESIEYAKIVQLKLFPSKQLLFSTLKKYFVIFEPLSKVSGDFYYVNEKNKFKIFAVGDCTGHGIPGALLSVLSISLLHDIIQRKEANTPAKVLELLRMRIKSMFNFFSTKDLHGLDIAFCVIDTKTNKLSFAGANLPMLFIRNNELVKYECVKNPIGYFYKEKPFENRHIKLQNGDKIYLTSDGYYDQMGGEKRRKMTKRRFIETLKNISSKPFFEQKQILMKNFIDWKGEQSQIDDVTILGIEWTE